MTILLLGICLSWLCFKFLGCRDTVSFANSFHFIITQFLKLASLYNLRLVIWICSGYMAPDYAIHGQLSVKADVYSFGVLLLEVITGRKNIDYNLSLEMQLLLGWVR